MTSRGNWVPSVDIYETTGRDLVIKAELPDINREDVEVTVENNTLTLKGHRNFPTDVKEEQFRRIERRYGEFVRSFTLPNTVDATKVSAEYKNGVLTVKLPFREEAKPRTINVEVAA
jgi:HSP20 family protein